MHSRRVRHQRDLGQPVSVTQRGKDRCRAAADVIGDGARRLRVLTGRAIGRDLAIDATPREANNPAELARRASLSARFVVLAGYSPRRMKLGVETPARKVRARTFGHIT